jgi:hypothetical protein
VSTVSVAQADGTRKPIVEVEQMRAVGTGGDHVFWVAGDEVRWSF